MKKKILTLIPYITILAIIFYLLPLVVKNTALAMLMMLIIMPVLTFVCTVIYGMRHGFDFILPILAIILFTPTIFIFYNSSAWIYIVIYAVIAFIGNGIGKIFYKK